MAGFLQASAGSSRSLKLILTQLPIDPDSALAPTDFTVLAVFVTSSQKDSGAPLSSKNLYRLVNPKSHS